MSDKLLIRPHPKGYFFHPDDQLLKGPLYTYSQIEAGFKYSPPAMKEEPECPPPPAQVPPPEPPKQAEVPKPWL